MWYANRVGKYSTEKGAIMAIVIKRAGITPTRDGVVAIPTTFTCVECSRVFDMFDEVDAEEWHYGHDCEVSE